LHRLQLTAFSTKRAHVFFKTYCHYHVRLSQAYWLVDWCQCT